MRCRYQLGLPLSRERAGNGVRVLGTLQIRVKAILMDVMKKAAPLDLLEKEAICENREKSGKTGKFVGLLKFRRKDVKLGRTRENSESVTRKKAANEAAGRWTPNKIGQCPKKRKFAKVRQSSTRNRVFRIAQAEQTDRRDKRLGL
jgi:hypothetical protein